MPTLIMQLIARYVLCGRVALVVPVINMAAGDIPDRNVGSDRVRKEAAGRIANGNLDSAMQLLYLELVGDTAVAGDQYWSSVPLWSDLRQCGFWFFFHVVFRISGDHGLLSTVVWNHLRMLMHVLVLMHVFQEE